MMIKMYENVNFHSKYGNIKKIKPKYFVKKLTMKKTLSYQVYRMQSVE